MAHKKGAGSSRNGRESHSQRLGIKIFGGEHGKGRQYSGTSARYGSSSRRKCGNGQGPYLVCTE